MGWAAFWVGLFGFASVAVIVWRAELVARVALAAKTADAASARVTPSTKPALPLDLEMIAQEEDQAWAQEQVRGAIHDLYEAQGDWDAVRTAYLGAR